MSAYIVNPDVIDVLARAACTTGRGPSATTVSWSWPSLDEEHGYAHYRAAYGGEEEVGRRLLRENERSIITRYPDCADDDGRPLYDRFPGPADYEGWEAYTFPGWSWAMPAPIDVLGIIAHYEYQSCESHDWQDTEAYAFCRSLTDRMHTLLPGWGTVRWDYTHPEPVRGVAA